MSNKLYIADYTHDRNTLKYYAQKGDIRRIHASLYVRADLTAEQERQVVISHAARICGYLYKDLPLSMGCAVARGAVNGKIILAAASQRAPVNISGVEFHFQKINAPYGIPYETAMAHDPIGEIPVRVLPDELVFLMAFRRPRGHAANVRAANGTGVISTADLSSIFERGVRVCGSKAAFIDRLKRLSGNMGMNIQLGHAIHYLNMVEPGVPASKPLSEHGVYFMGRRVADLIHDGREWIYTPKGKTLPLSLCDRTIDGSTIPFFIDSIFPERGEIGRADPDDIDFNEIKTADRYVSNIIIRELGHSAPIIIDELEACLSAWTGDSGQFLGTSKGLPNEFNDNLYREIEAMNRAHDCPRLSGVQLKMPVNLSPDGVVSPANGKKFTHILKLPGLDTKLTLGSNEWYSMTLARESGIKTEEFGIMTIPGLGPTLIAERFDIPSAPKNGEVVMGEDFCSIMGLTRKNKYSMDMTRVAERLMAHSTSPEADAEQAFRSTVFSWLIGNTDAHLKNIMMLKRFDRECTEYKSIELAPAFDLICAMIYINVSDAALPIGGSRIYAANEFHLLGKSLGLKPADCIKIIRDVCERLEAGIDKTMNNLPDAILNHSVATPDGQKNLSLIHIGKINQIISARSAVLMNEIENTKQRRTKFSFGA